MATYPVPITPQQFNRLTPDLIAGIDQYLRSNNFRVDGVTLQAEPDFALVVDADRDPTTALASWTPEPSVQGAEMESARSVAVTYRDKVKAGQTVTQAESVQALAAVITLLERFAATV